jgi:hypothetical protein
VEVFFFLRFRETKIQITQILSLSNAEGERSFENSHHLHRIQGVFLRPLSRLHIGPHNPGGNALLRIAGLLSHIFRFMVFT